MGKEKPGFLTPKAIANRIKSKGLQKLRWYCQMCQKQCRDENGFKCHAMSESHQRQLLLFAENSSKFMDEFSSEFNREYINTLKRRFGTKRVHSNVVYQEYISDRNHIHMNSTKWLTLGDYVKYLGRIGACVVEETEKGWFVTYIDRDPETMRRQAEADKKKKLDLDDRQRQQMYLDKQMEKDKDLDVKLAEPTELKKSEDEVIKISFMKTIPSISKPDQPKTSESILKEVEFKVPSLTEFKVPGEKAEKRKKSALDEIMESQEKKREKVNRKDHWLHRDIVVKIITNKLGEKYYKKKCVVTDVSDLYTGVVKLLDSDTVLKLDQTHLETVLPAIGKKVLVLNGAYRGEEAYLDEIDQDAFSAKLTIASGPLKGRVVNNVQYEDISKLNQE